MISKNRGFTLIEIMVAMLILAGLSLIMAQSVRTGLDDRKKIQLQLSEESLIRDAMRLIVSDVAAAFHHRDYTVGLYNKVLELRKKKAAGGVAGIALGAPGAAPPPAAGQSSGAPPTATAQTAADPLAAATPLPVPTQLTGFNGNADSMTFTLRNHVRRFVDSKDSDQSRVSYFLRSCRSPGPKALSSNCLYRLETTNPTDEFPLSPPDEDDAVSVVLVRNVTNFKLRYIVFGQQEFTDTWDSSPKASTGVTRDRFPDAVEISMAIMNKSNPQARERKLTWLAPVRASNNADESDKDSTSDGTNTSNPNAAKSAAPSGVK